MFQGRWNPGVLQTKQNWTRIQNTFTSNVRDYHNNSLPTNIGLLWIQEFKQTWLLGWLWPLALSSLGSVSELFIMQEGHKIKLDGSSLFIKPIYFKINYLTYRIKLWSNHFGAAWAVLGFLCLSVAPWVLCKPVSITNCCIDTYTTDKELLPVRLTRIQ